MAERCVALIHYHLRPAGVTRVIELSAAALLEAGCRVCVVVGESADLALPENCPVVVEPALGYGQSHRAYPASELYQRLRAQISDRLGTPPDLWHIHNHSLGKNSTLPALASHLGQCGEAVLLQIHDFAEDFRPSNYAWLRSELGGDENQFSAVLYPSGKTVHYALLNQRDRSYLQQAGAAPERLHDLPNAVKRQKLPPVSSGSALLIYPSTGIRRKNLGEILFWAARAKDTFAFAVTRAPSNPEALPVYQTWVDFSRHHHLPIQFEYGNSSQSFEEILSASAGCITTSVAEGFGLGFLEPWLMGRPLVGRNLPDITADFSAQGIDLDPLYDSLPIPLSLLDRAQLESLWNRSCQSVFQQFGLNGKPTPDLAMLFENHAGEPCVDFGRLNETLQQQVLAKIMDAPECLTPLRDISRMLELSQQVLSSNQQSVQSAYSISSYSRRLLTVYDHVAESARQSESTISSQLLLDQFLDPRKFTLLRTD